MCRSMVDIQSAGAEIRRGKKERRRRRRLKPQGKPAANQKVKPDVNIHVKIHIRKSQIALRYPGRRQVRGWAQTCRRPASELDMA